MIRFLKLCAAVVGLGLGLVLPALAQAQTLPASAIALTVGNYLTIDGVKITVTGTSVDCSQGSADTGCGNLYMVPNSGPSASVIIEAALGGIGSALEPIESEACGSICTSGFYDLSLTLTATTVAGSAPLTGASVAITGSLAPGGFGTTVGGTENFIGVNGCSGLSATLASPQAACSFAPSNSVEANKDFGVNIGNSGAPGTYQLATITETFSTPEPASFTCLLSGALAIAAVRRRRRRQS